MPENQNSSFFVSKEFRFFEPFYENKPFIKGMENFVYINEGNRINSIPKNKFETYINDKLDTVHYPSNQIINLPYSLIFSFGDYKINKDGAFNIDKLSSEQIQEILSPFYFSKYEADIKEYYDFLNWVWEANGFKPELKNC